MHTIINSRLMRWHHYIPAFPPPEGRYLVQRFEHLWEEGRYHADEMVWRYPDGHGPMSHVHFFMTIKSATIDLDAHLERTDDA